MCSIIRLSSFSSSLLASLLRFPFKSQQPKKFSRGKSSVTILFETLISQHCCSEIFNARAAWTNLQRSSYVSVQQLLMMYSYSWRASRMFLKEDCGLKNWSKRYFAFSMLFLSFSAKSSKSSSSSFLEVPASTIRILGALYLLESLQLRVKVYANLVKRSIESSVILPFPVAIV